MPANTDEPFKRKLRQIQELPYWDRRIAINRMTKPRLKRFIYKYRAIDSADDISIDRLRDLIVKSKLWLSSPKDFNDPFDMSAKVVAFSTGTERRAKFMEILKNQGIGYKKREQRIKDLMQRSPSELEIILNQSYVKNLPKIGVYSFAGDPRSILMWSHYANEHSGICVQFEIARDIYTLSGALPVEYNYEYPEVNWVNNFSRSLGKVLLRKHDGWAYEKESRIVRPDQARTYLDVNPQAIVGIIFGCRTSSETKSAVTELIEERRNKQLPDIRLYAAHQHKSKYRLSIYRE